MMTGEVLLPRQDYKEVGRAMKKITFLSIVLMVGLLLMGWLGAEAQAGDLKMYPVTNTTAVRAKTQISTSTIVPGKDWILGYELIPFGPSASVVDPYVELHDAATTGAQTQTTGGTMFSANELDTSPLQSKTTIFPKLKKLSLGLSINLGGYTAVIIYYERLVP